MNAPNPHIQRAMILQQQRRFAEAEEQWRQAIMATPQEGRLHAMLAFCMMQREGGEAPPKVLDEAQGEAQAAIGMTPDDAFAHFVLAQVLFRRNRIHDAADAIGEAIRLDPYDPDYFSLRGWIRMEQRDWRGALHAAEQGLAIDAEHPNCNNLRAMALVKLGRRAEAGQTIDSTLARDPDDAFTHANRGWALLHENKPTDALHHFREALRLDPTSEWARAGIVEALKARNPIYRWMLAYFLWMGRLSGQAQWAIIIGLWLGNRIIGNIAQANPQWAPYLNVLLLLYLIFAIMTWLAYPLFNLLLRINKFGRLALNRQQTVASNWVGSSLGLGVLAFVLFVLTGQTALLIAAIVFGLMTMPLAGVFSVHSGWPKWLMIAVSAGLALMGLAAASLIGIGSRANEDFAMSLLSAFAWGILLTTLGYNWLRTVRPTR